MGEAAKGMTVLDLINKLKMFDLDKSVLIHNSDGCFMRIDRVEANTKFDNSPCVVIRQW